MSGAWKQKETDKERSYLYAIKHMRAWKKFTTKERKISLMLVVIGVARSSDVQFQSSVANKK